LSAGPTGGRLLTGPGGAGLYSRGRDMGADDMVVTGAGLWIAATIWTAPTGAAASVAMPGSASCPTAPSPAAGRIAAPRSLL